jgi:hypothetical protein
MRFARGLAIRKSLTVYGLALLFFCPALSAQKKWIPAAEVWGGYSYLRFESTTLGFSDQLNLNGWNGGISLPDLYQGFGVLADVSGHYSTPLEQYNFLIGPEYSYQWKSFRISGHAMFGKARTRLREPGSTQLGPSTLNRSIALGGAVDVPFTEHISFRILQGDYLRSSAFGIDQSNVRLSTGVIYRFGKR